MKWKLIEYTVLKAVQVLALVTLPICAYGEFTAVDGSWFWGAVDIWLWYTFYQEAKTNKLEKKYIIDILYE
jgi:hypothetical protein